MAVIDYDGHDDWGSQADAIVGGPYMAAVNIGGGTYTWANNIGRFGGGGLRTLASSAAGYNVAVNVFNYGSNLATAIWQGAMKFNGFGSDNTHGCIMFYDATLGQVAIGFDAVNVTALRGLQSSVLGAGNVAGTSIGSAAHGLLTGQWYWVAVKVFISATVGTVGVWVNGVQILNLAGVNTKATGNSSVSIAIHGSQRGNAGTAADITYDDTVWSDTTGSAPYNDVLGDRRVHSEYPSADSAVAWTKNGGANNFSRVNETANDADATYVSDAAGAIDDYNHDPSPVNLSTIDMIKVASVARKDDAGARNIILGAVSGGVAGVSAGQVLNTTYGYYKKLLLTDPNTSAAWTKTNWDNAKIRISNS